MGKLKFGVSSIVLGKEQKTENLRYDSVEWGEATTIQDFFRAGGFLIGAKGRKAGGVFFRRPGPGGGQREGGRAPRTYRAERRGQPPQPHGDRGGHHVQAG